MAFNDVMHDGDLIHRIEKLEKLLRDKTSGRSLEHSSIGGGGLRIVDGGSLVVDGGELVLRAENGIPVARWGDVGYGGTARGWEFLYPSGQRAFLMGGEPENPAIVIYDVAGNVVFATDAASRYGVARPYVNYRIVPALSAQGWGEGTASLWPSSDSTSYVGLFEGYNPIWHPRIAYRVATTTTGGGSVDWRIRFNDTVMAEGNNTSSGTVDVPGWGTNIRPGGEANFVIEARRAGGATRIWLQCTKFYGLQS